jgi:hypothetical protein
VFAPAPVQQWDFKHLLPAAAATLVLVVGMLSKPTLHALLLSVCASVQVQHFDELQEAKARAVRNLHNTINTTAATAAGNLAGTSQQ